MTVRELDPANDLLATPPALRTRLDEDGFVFLRDLLPREVLSGVRHEVLECCRAAGWLVPGENLENGLADPPGLAWSRNRPSSRGSRSRSSMR